MGRIIVKNKRDLYNPLIRPDVSGLVPNITGIAPDQLRNQSLVPGDVVELDGSTSALSFNHTISGIAGTQENPIWVLGNGSAFADRAVEWKNNEWVYFQDCSFLNSSNNGLKIEDCENCMFGDFTLDGMSSNGVRVDGTTSRPNNHLQFFNFNITNWGGSDGFSLHASNTEENNGSWFVIKDLTCQNPVDTADGGLDITSGNNVYVWGYRGTDATVQIGHGVQNIYLYDVESNLDTTSGRNVGYQFRNTDGNIWMGKVRGSKPSGTLEIDLGVQGSPRSNEAPNSTLGLFITYELQLWDNILPIDNNTGGSGTIVTSMEFNKLGYLEFDGFNRWPNSL